MLHRVLFGGFYLKNCKIAIYFENTDSIGFSTVDDESTPRNAFRLYTLQETCTVFPRCMFCVFNNPLSLYSLRFVVRSTVSPGYALGLHSHDK